jgi:WhiB family redox-sensing transcriptional regulator
MGAAMTGVHGLPPGPLLDLLAARARDADLPLGAFVRERFGRNADRSLWRWKAGGTVRRDLADRFCQTLGVHPTAIWPDTWERAEQTPPRFRRTVVAEHWWDDAACRGEDPNVMFPTTPEGVEWARAHCFDCTVFDACYEFGLTQEYGVWGGTSEEERRSIRRPRGLRLAHEIGDSA